MQNSMTRKEACFYLGVSENATMEQIKRAYKDKVKLYHPDVNPNSYDYYIKIQNAYDFLLTHPYNIITNMQYNPTMQNIRPARVFSSTAQTRATYNRQKDKEKEVEKLHKWDAENKENKKSQMSKGAYNNKNANMNKTRKSKEDEALDKIRAIWLAETVKKQIERDKLQKEAEQKKRLYEAFMKHELHQDS
jgi:curved DNA-binding protein CbpA